MNATNFGKSSRPVEYLDIVVRHEDAHWELEDVKTRGVSLSEPKEVLLKQNFVCKMGAVTLDDYVPLPLRMVQTAMGIDIDIADVVLVSKCPYATKRCESLSCDCNF